MVLLMPKSASEADEEGPKEPVTTIKAYKRTVRLMAKIGALKGISQPEVLALYEKRLSEKRCGSGHFRLAMQN